MTFITNMNKNERHFNFTKFSKLCLALQFLVFRDFGILVHKDPMVKYMKPKSPVLQLVISRVRESKTLDSFPLTVDTRDATRVWFFSLLASATHDHSLGLSAIPLRYSHLHELWHPTLVPPFHETPRSDVDFSPLVLATSRLREFHCHAPMHLSREFPKSRVTLFSRPTAQLSLFTTMVGGIFMRVHVAFNDVIGSHLSRFSLHPIGTWYFAMCPRPILEKSDGQIFLRSTAQILSGFWASIYRCTESPIRFYRAFDTRDLASSGLRVPYTWALTL
jgi:hypothetical protein